MSLYPSALWQKIASINSIDFTIDLCINGLRIKIEGIFSPYDKREFDVMSREMGGEWGGIETVSTSTVSVPLDRSFYPMEADALYRPDCI
jgi:hypothetical protein